MFATENSLNCVNILIYYKNASNKVVSTLWSKQERWQLVSMLKPQGLQP